MSDALPVSDGLLKATFDSWPEERRATIEGGGFKAYCKFDGDVMRLHHVEASFQNHGRDLTILMTILDQTARARGCKSITFGGGEWHIYPGIPVNGLHEPLLAWLRYFEPRGQVVRDFEGPVDQLIKNASPVKSEGVLHSPSNEAEIRDLIGFVAREFPGRWHRECESDARKGLIKHYFAYLIGGEIAGYARLYGWDPNYWAPGVYFAQPGRGQGGLGPIGVASKNRGRGFGTQILNLSWKILKAHQIANVRIDWTTETKFYEQWGLRTVQEYQPAVRSL